MMFRGCAIGYVSNDRKALRRVARILTVLDQAREVLGEESNVQPVVRIFAGREMPCRQADLLMQPYRNAR